MSDGPTSDGRMGGEQPGPHAPGAQPVVLVTGLSGAGKASILRVLEDLGFETVDNPPLKVLEELVEDGEEPIAAGIDTRTRGFVPAHALVTLAQRLRALQDRGLAEVPSTRVLVAAARLIAGGIGARAACYAAVVSPLSDDESLRGAMRDLVDATFV